MPHQVMFFMCWIFEPCSSAQGGALHRASVMAVLHEVATYDVNRSAYERLGCACEGVAQLEQASSFLLQCLARVSATTRSNLVLPCRRDHEPSSILVQR